MNELRYALQGRDELPRQLDWLTRSERARFDGFRFDKRRQDWLLGRWAAKKALLALSELPRSDIARFEVLSASNGAPVARLDGRPHDIGLSISHSHDRAFATASNDVIELGCDIELVEPRSEAFVDTFFTAAECRRVQRTASEYRDVLVTLMWSAKESTLKALQTGLHVDTRSVQVVADGDFAGRGWSTARTVADDAGEFRCLYRLDNRFVVTIATRDPVEISAER